MAWAAGELSIFCWSGVRLRSRSCGGWPLASMSVRLWQLPRYWMANGSGSGPSGLTAAGDLVQKGHQVHVFEALHTPGGVLVYGIPEFRLPKQIIREQIDYMRAMGVEFETNVVVGRTVTIDELMNEEGYDAVFIGTARDCRSSWAFPANI